MGEGDCGNCVPGGGDVAGRGASGAQAAHVPPCVPQLAHLAQEEHRLQVLQFPEPEHAAAAKETTPVSAMIHNRRM